MQFYLGTHLPTWLEDSTVPLFVCQNQLSPKAKRLPRAAQPWALDSGGFTELSQYGAWRIDATEYANRVERYANEIGRLDFIAPQDWMCEPFIIAKTGLSVEEHQRRTLDNFLELRTLKPELPFIPVLQGWKFDDYLRHIEMYQRAGIDLGKEPRVGLGSVCRRQHTSEIDQLVTTLRRENLRLHAFGVKTLGLASYGHLVASADSLAWSEAASNEPAMPGHEADHAKCTNCVDYALRWRDNVLKKLSVHQGRFDVEPVEPHEELMTYSPGDSRRSGVESSLPEPETPLARRSRSRQLKRVRIESAAHGVHPIFEDPDGCFVGEIVSVGDKFRPVTLGVKSGTFGLFDTVKDAAVAAGWSIGRDFRDDFEEEKRYATAWVKNGNRVSVTLLDTENAILGSKLFRSIEDMKFAQTRGDNIFETPQQTQAGRNSIVEVWTDAWDGMHFRTSANATHITGPRYCRDVVIDEDFPVPEFRLEQDHPKRIQTLSMF